jgi:uncharacterized protein GlcG (DUF336 family)
MKFTVLTLSLVGSLLAANGPARNATCAALPTAADLRTLLINAASPAGAATYGTVGGLFEGRRMWAAVVNSDGELCASNTSTNDQRDVWPGSQAIAQAKAYTANAFSLDDFALSTARLYTFTQPGHSLNSLGQSNLFNPRFLATPDGHDGGENQIAGGLIFFGGGVPIYESGKIVGGLGVSGDTACADHEVAKRVRDLAGLNPPAALGGMLGDDIIYTASVFAHPVCPNTYKNGSKIGNEAPASYPFVP